VKRVVREAYGSRYHLQTHPGRHIQAYTSGCTTVGVYLRVYTSGLGETLNTRVYLRVRRDW